jgi:hypothetical protein
VDTNDGRLAAGLESLVPALVAKHRCAGRRAGGRRNRRRPCPFDQRDQRLPVFGSELLDPIGVPGIWFPFGIGVSRTQYIYAIAIPLLAFLIVRTLPANRDELVATPLQAA